MSVFNIVQCFVITVTTFLFFPDFMEVTHTDGKKKNKNKALVIFESEHFLLTTRARGVTILLFTNYHYLMEAFLYYMSVNKFFHNSHLFLNWACLEFRRLRVSCSKKILCTSCWRKKTFSLRPFLEHQNMYFLVVIRTKFKGQKFPSFSMYPNIFIKGVNLKLIPSFRCIHCWIFSHKLMTSLHFWNRWSRSSSCVLQREQILLVVIFNFFRYFLVPNILFKMRYWNHIELLSRIE